MNSNMIVRFFMAAALTTVAGFAQNALTAEVTFPFHSGRGAFQAGRYEVRTMVTPGSARLLMVVSESNPKSGMALARYEAVMKPSESGSHLKFECYPTSGCYLREVWPGPESKWVIDGPKIPAAEKERMLAVVVRLHPVQHNGD